MESATFESGANGVAELAMCAEGASLTVWNGDFDPDTESDDTDPLLREMEEQGSLEHLRGENWHIMSVDGDLLDEMQQTYGGERNEEGFPNLNR